MRLSEVRAVFVKELRGLLRDGHTLIYTVAVPAFLYPLLLLGVSEVFSYVEAISERRLSRVELQVAVPAGPGGDKVAEELSSFLGREEHKLEISTGRASTSDDTRERLGDERLGGPRPQLDAVVVATRETVAELAPVQVELRFNAAADRSLMARNRLTKALDSYRRERLVSAARSLGEEESFVQPLEVREVSLSTSQEVSNYLAALILPILMILMIALGAFYPALETTVGEKERGTLETTLVSPIGREALVTGKYLAVTTMAVVSFVLNLASMAVTLSLLEMGGKVNLSIGLGSALVITATALLLAAFFSALMMLIAFLARSFKEGQAYVSPIYLLSFIPILVAMRPDLHLTPTLALVPLVNATLLFRDALESRFDFVCIALTLVTSAALAVAALLLAARVLSRESVVTGGEVSWREVVGVLFGRRSQGAAGIEERA